MSPNISCPYAAKPLVLFSFVTANAKTASVPSESAETAEANHESDGYRSWADLPEKLLLTVPMNMKLYDSVCVRISRRKSADSFTSHI